MPLDPPSRAARDARASAATDPAAAAGPAAPNARPAAATDPAPATDPAAATDPALPILQVAHTAALSAAQLSSAEALLARVFGEDLDEHDWEHACGGVHAIVWEGGRAIAHGAVVQRRLIHRGRALRAGYVEGVAVDAERRRSGHGATVMAALEHVIERAYDLGALAATELGCKLYLTRGWRRWGGRSFALTPDGVVRTAEDDGAILVFRASAALDLHGELTCDWRDGELW